MSEAKHTPGPWRVDEVDDCFAVGTEWTNTEDHGNGLEEHGVGVAMVYGGPEQSEGNARLIAAAPDLLAACRRALAEMDGNPQGPGCVRILRKAIAKAEGGGE